MAVIWSTAFIKTSGYGFSIFGVGIKSGLESTGCFPQLDVKARILSWRELMAFSNVILRKFPVTNNEVSVAIRNF